MSAPAVNGTDVAVEYDHGSDVQPAVSWSQPNTDSYPTQQANNTTPALSASALPAAAPSEPSVNVLVEGKARIPYTVDEGVFYNKVQVFNRDLSILCITTFVKKRQQEWMAQREEREKRRRKQKEGEASKQRQEKAKAERDEKMEAEDSTTNADTTANSTSSSSGNHSLDITSPSSHDSSTSPPVPPFAGIRILEALSATGLRSIRYWLEIPDVQSIVINDLDAKAVQSIRTNLAYNNLTSPQLIPTQSDAKLLMYMYNSLAPTAASSLSFAPSAAGPYDVIDLDPYGSACEFFDCSVQSVSDGGLLCITCTDKAVLCGSWGEVAFAKYGGYALKGKNCHEMAIRLVLGALQSAAGRYRRYIAPLLSLSIDFYVRVFVRVYEGQMHVKDGASKMGVVYQCTGCEAMYLQRLGRLAMARDGATTKHSPAVGPPIPTHCPDCSSTFRVGGPVYLEALHDSAFITSSLEYAEQHKSDFSTYPRIQAMLNVARKELPVPFYVCMSHLCHVLHAPQPKIWLLRAALIHAGYAVSDTHALPDGIKTTAPPTVVWDILRCYVRECTEPKGKPTADSVAGHILSKEPQLKADFSYVEGCDSSTKNTGMAKFLPNPENYWGPKERANRSKRSSHFTHRTTSRSQLSQRRVTAVMFTSSPLPVH